MCGIKAKSFKPNAKNHAVYQDLYRLYRQLHDAFGTEAATGSLFNVMKDLLTIRDRQLS
jgi:L-ribulokinase